MRSDNGVRASAAAVNRLVAWQKAGNLKAADHWDRYRSHREAVTKVLLAATSRTAPRLALLGVGNGCDVDLEALTERYAHVAICDIDQAALARAMARLSPRARAAVTPHAPMDVSGVMHELDLWRERPPLAPDLERAIEADTAAVVRRLAPTEAQAFDVVGSLCLMTQLSWAVSAILGHSEQPPVRDAVLVAHLSVMAGILRAGGTGLIFNDVVSSEHYPLDALGPTTDLRSLLAQLVAAGSAHKGANPFFLRQQLRHSPRLRARPASVDMRGVWLWEGPLERTYLVYALGFERL